MGEGFDHTALRHAIAAVHSDLTGVSLRPLAVGFDSVAYGLGPLIVKRPKNAAAEAGLRREAAYLAVLRPQVSLPVPDLHLVEGPLVSWHVALPGKRLEAAG